MYDAFWVPIYVSKQYWDFLISWVTNIQWLKPSLLFSDRSKARTRQHLCAFYTWQDHGSPSWLWVMPSAHTAAGMATGTLSAQTGIEPQFQECCLAQLPHWSELGSCADLLYPAPAHPELRRDMDLSGCTWQADMVWVSQTEPQPGRLSLWSLNISNLLVLLCSEIIPC